MKKPEALKELVRDWAKEMALPAWVELRAWLEQNADALRMQEWIEEQLQHYKETLPPELWPLAEKRNPHLDPPAVLVDWYLEHQPEDYRGVTDWVEAKLEEIKRENERRIRRENIEEVLREQGNLEKDPWGVQDLTTDDRLGQVGIVGNNLEGVPLYLIEGTLHGKGLYMDSAPEHLQRELEDEYPHTASFVTIYTDGGGYQTEEPEALYDPKAEEVWQRVYSGAHQAEVECPYADWDPGEREDDQDRVVTVSDTYYGENPGKSCRFCEADLGEEHGYLYVGEGGEYVYVKVPQLAPMLKQAEEMGVEDAEEDLAKIKKYGDEEMELTLDVIDWDDFHRIFVDDFNALENQAGPIREAYRAAYRQRFERG